MSESTARGLAGAGALLSLASLLAPWYVLRFGNLSDLGRSGVAALGALAIVVAALAIAAGWSGAARLHPLLPPLSAAALVLIVAVKLASPPAASSAFTSTSNDFGSQLANSLASAFASGFGLHYAPAWGLWLAMIGSAAAFIGASAAAIRSKAG